MLSARATPFAQAAMSSVKIWVERTKSPVIAGPQGSDSSACLQCIVRRRATKLDVLLSTPQAALQNQAELMNELEMSFVLKKGRCVGAACGGCWC